MPQPRAARAGRAKIPRMPPAKRKAILLERAAQFFAEHGMSATTRALAEACGVTQRLLYRYFPSKAALLTEVYQQAILAPFKAAWLVRLADRGLPIGERINLFYQDYYRTVLSRQWMRLFLFDGLDGGAMAGAFIDGIVKQLLDVLVTEAAAALQVELPAARDLRHQLGWVLHGAVSHLAIRQHVYGAGQATPVETVLAMQVAAFLDGLPVAADLARAAEAADIKSSVYDL